MTVDALLLTATLAAATPGLCQQAWTRARQIRVELGYPAGPATPPEPMDERICRLTLDMPEDRLRESMRRALEAMWGPPTSDLEAEERP